MRDVTACKGKQVLSEQSGIVLPKCRSEGAVGKSSVSEQPGAQQDCKCRSVKNEAATDEAWLIFKGRFLLKILTGRILPLHGCFVGVALAVLLAFWLFFVISPLLRSMCRSN